MSSLRRSGLLHNLEENEGSGKVLAQGSVNWPHGLDAERAQSEAGLPIPDASAASEARWQGPPTDDWSAEQPPCTVCKTVSLGSEPREGRAVLAVPTFALC